MERFFNKNDNTSNNYCDDIDQHYMVGIPDDGKPYGLVDGIVVGTSQTDEYLAEQELKEQERVSNLSMTPRDFILGLESLGVSFEDTIEPLIASNAQVRKELNYCQAVYRGNALLDALCSVLGVTTEQLDYLFKTYGS